MENRGIRKRKRGERKIREKGKEERDENEGGEGRHSINASMPSQCQHSDVVTPSAWQLYRLSPDGAPITQPTISASEASRFATLSPSAFVDTSLQ